MTIQRIPLTRWQKRIAYLSLAAVLAWTAFSIYAIWLLVARTG